MPQIEFDERTLTKVKQGVGMYRRTPANKIFEDSGFIKELRNQLMKTIEVAFREYAKKHKGCTPKLENEEWKRFEKILKKIL